MLIPYAAIIGENVDSFLPLANPLLFSHIFLDHLSETQNLILIGLTLVNWNNCCLPFSVGVTDELIRP